MKYSTIQCLIVDLGHFQCELEQGPYEDSLEWAASLRILTTATRALVELRDSGLLDEPAQDLRDEAMGDFDPSEGNTFADHALRCADQGKVLLTKSQAQAVEDHLDCMASSVDALTWGYGGRVYTIDGPLIDGTSPAYWLTSSGRP